MLLTMCTLKKRRPASIRFDVSPMQAAAGKCTACCIIAALVDGFRDAADRSSGPATVSLGQATGTGWLRGPKPLSLPAESNSITFTSVTDNLGHSGPPDRDCQRVRQHRRWQVGKQDQDR